MNHNTNPSFSPEVEEAIKDYLDKVEQRLRGAGTAPSESRAVRQDLDAQIREQLLSRRSNPTWNDLTSILATMDSPEQFRHHAEPAGSSRSQFKIVRIVIFTVIVATGVYMLLREKPAQQEPVADSPAVENTAARTSEAVKKEPDVNTGVEQEVVPEIFRSDAPDQTAAAPEIEEKPASQTISVAVASFGSSPNMRDPGTVRLALTDGLINYLSSFNGIRVVERERINEALQDLRMSSEGMIDASSAMELGKMTGARVIITGNILQIDDQLVLTARLINTETSELLATRTKGSRSELLNVIDELAAGIADRLVEENQSVLARPVDQDQQRKAEQLAALKQSIAGHTLPRVIVLLPESHLGRMIPDPAGETELTEWMLNCGFQVAAPEYEGIEVPREQAVWAAQSHIRFQRQEPSGPLEWLISSQTVQSYVKGGMAKDAAKLQEIADVFIIGEGVSERASQRAGIVSCKARLELKVIDITSGNILLAKSTYGAGLDVAEHIAGKRALQAAGRQMATELIPALADVWTKNQKTAE